MESEAESVKNLSAGVEMGAGFAASDQLNIPGQGLEPCTVRLQNGDGDVAGLARLDVLDDTRLASMSTADDFALGAVFQLFVGGRFHAGMIALSSNRQAIRGRRAGGAQGFMPSA